MFKTSKQKAKEKNSQYKDKLLGSSSPRRAVGQSTLASVNDTRARPTTGLLKSALDSSLLVPSSSSRVTTTSTSQPAATASALHSADTLPPTFQPDSSNPSAVQESVPVEATLVKSAASPSAGWSVKSTIWPGVKVLLKLLDQNAEAYGPLQPAIRLISECVDIYESEAKAREDFRKLKVELDSLFWKLFGHLNGPTSPSPPVLSCLVDLAKDIEQEIGIVMKKGKRNGIKRMAEAKEDADEILECYRRIQIRLQRFSLDANVSTWIVVNEQAMELRLKALAPSLSAQYGSAESTDLRRNACIPGTRVEVLGKLMAWAENAESEKIYWLNGMAGTGKTTIAFSFCDQLETSLRLCASFFCSRQLEACRNANLIIPTVAYQLARFSHPFHCLLYKALRLHPDVHTRKITEQFQKLIVDPLLEAGDAISPSLVVVIDALDECANKGGVGQILETLISHAPKLRIKFFVASRPEPLILDAMQVPRNEGVPTELRLHELDEPTVQKDIRRYLKNELWPAMLTDGDLERLVAQSGVLFIYAATIVRYIGEDNFSRSAKRLELVLATSSSTERGSDYMIGVLYTSILEAAFDDARDRSDRDEMVGVLHMIMCAQEPLKTGVIAGLLEFNIPSVQAALRPLRSVLHLSEPSGVVTTLHKSFPDYIFDKNRSGAFFCDVRNSHALIARRCFNLIGARTPPFNICNLESSYVFDNQIPDFERRVKAAISDEMVYACQHWSAHLKLAAHSSELLGHLYEFLSVRLLLWMEVMNLKEHISAGVKALHQVQEWLQAVSSSDDIRALALDAWMFASTFSESPMSRSTPHIYVSALPFWPDHRPISKHYLPKMRGMIGVTGTASKREHLQLGSLVVSVTPKGRESLEGHSNGVTWVACLYDGLRMVSGSADKTIRIWDVHASKMIGEPLRGHTGYVHSVAFSHDGTRIVSGSADKTIRVWDVNTGRMIGEPLRGHTGDVCSVAFSRNSTRIISGSWDKTIRIWDTHTGQMVRELQGHTRAVQSVVISHDGTRIVSGSNDDTIQIWDAHTGQKIGEPLTGHTNTVRSVAYSHDGTRIVSGSDDNTIRIWDVRTGGAVGEPLTGHKSYVYSVVFSHDDTRIASGSWDKTIRVWDAQTGQMIGEPLIGHSGPVESVAYSHDGACIISGSADSTIRIWDAQVSYTIDGVLVDHSAALQEVNQTTRPGQLNSGASHAPNLASSRFPPTDSHTPWTLHESGWLRKDHSKLLIWIPSKLRGSILFPRNLALISTRGSLMLDFSSAQLGENWLN